MEGTQMPWLYSIILFLLFHCGYVKSAVTISPPGVARVCSGGQLELMCTTAGGFLRWRFNVTRGLNDTVRQTRTIQAAVPAGDAMFRLVVNSTMFNFSRISAEGSLPVMSKAVIGPVSSSLNGTVMSCIDLDTSNLSSTIIITKREPLQELNVREYLVEFETDSITITLEWNELNPLYSVNVSIMPETQVNISGSTAQLTVTYNVMYNVSITISHLCERNDDIVTVFSEVYYYPRTATTTPVCGSPEELIDTGDSLVTVSGYTPPAVEGTTITFHCPPGAVLHGINSSTCMENGEWEPAPFETNCLLGPDPFSGLTEDGKIAVASSVTFVAGSSMFLIIGFLCRHFCRKERHNSQTSTGPRTSNWSDQRNILSTPVYDDVVIQQSNQELELKENLAYGPI